MLESFCSLPKSSANAIVVNFGMSMMDKLGNSVKNTGKISLFIGRSATLDLFVKSNSFS